MDEVRRNKKRNLYRGSFFLFFFSPITLSYFAQYDSEKSPWIWKLWKSFQFGFFVKHQRKKTTADYEVVIDCSDPRVWQQTGSCNGGREGSCLLLPALALPGGESMLGSTWCDSVWSYTVSPWHDWSISYTARANSAQFCRIFSIFDVWASAFFNQYSHFSLKISCLRFARSTFFFKFWILFLFFLFSFEVSTTCVNYKSRYLLVLS